MAQTQLEDKGVPKGPTKAVPTNVADQGVVSTILAKNPLVGRA